MQLLREYLDFGVLGVLGLMSFLLLGFVIERSLYLSRVDLGRFDDALVLLAIVLTTATFLVEGRIDIRLPEAAGTAKDAARAQLELGVDRDGQVLVGASPVTIEELGPRLDALAPQTSIILRVDADARFVAVVDLLKARGLERLTILVRNP